MMINFDVFGIIVSLRYGSSSLHQRGIPIAKFWWHEAAYAVRIRHGRAQRDRSK
jgi:hypothetical protein